MPILLNVKKLYSNSQLPSKATNQAACYDLYGHSRTLGLNKPYVEYGTGIAIALQPGFCALVYCRSSISNIGATLANCVGVIDSDYRGEIKLRFYSGPSEYPYELGDRIGQMMVIEVPEIALVSVSELETTERGSGAYGSTGA